MLSLQDYLRKLKGYVSVIITLLTKYQYSFYINVCYVLTTIQRVNDLIANNCLCMCMTYKLFLPC